MNRKVLVVGGTGYVGRQVVGALQQRGADVRVLVRPGVATVTVPNHISAARFFRNNPLDFFLGLRKLLFARSRRKPPGAVS